jgi:NitT/TauT family transport system substrate-binding protein
MEDTLRIVRWYLDPANQKEVAQIAAKLTKQPAERFGWVFTKQDYYRNPDMIPDLEALQRNLDMTKDLGFVKGDIDVKKYTDLSIVQEALKRVK